MKRKILIVALCLAFLGCKGISGSIEKNSMKLISKSEIGEVIGEDIDNGLLTYWTEGDLIHVKISSEKDLIQLANKKSATLDVDFYFCEAPDVEAMLGLPSLYQNGKNLNNHHLLGNRGYESSSLVKYEYDAIMFTKFIKERKVPLYVYEKTSQKYYKIYDFASKPEDVCFVVKGANMISTFQSEELRITASEIRDVMN